MNLNTGKYKKINVKFLIKENQNKYEVYYASDLPFQQYFKEYTNIINYGYTQYNANKSKYFDICFDEFKMYLFNDDFLGNLGGFWNA